MTMAEMRTNRPWPNGRLGGAELFCVGNQRPQNPQRGHKRAQMNCGDLGGKWTFAASANLREVGGQADALPREAVILSSRCLVRASEVGHTWGIVI